MNKILNNIIIASIFVVPMASIIPIHDTIIWYPQLLALMTLGFICFAMFWWEDNKFISLFLIYAIFSYLFVCSQSPRAMLCLVTGYSGMVFSHFVSESNTSKIYKALLIISAINTLFLLLQVLKLDPIFTPTTGFLIDRFVGLMGSRNQLGIFHAGISTLLIGMSPWCALFSIPLIIIKCSSTIFGFIAGTSVYLFIKGKKLIAFLLVSLFVLLIPVLINSKKELPNELKERTSLWTLTINQIISGKVIEDDKVNTISPLHREVTANSLFGFGIGNFFVISPMSQGILWPKGTHQARYEHAHNDLVEAIFEFGYIGFILILLCISKVISDFMTCANKTNGVIISFCSLICLSVCSLGVYVFHAPVSLFLFCLILGLFYAEVKNAKQSQIA